MRRPSHAHRGRRHHQPQRNKACMLGQCHRTGTIAVARGTADGDLTSPHLATRMWLCLLSPTASKPSYVCLRLHGSETASCQLQAIVSSSPCMELWKRLACLHLFPGNSQGSV
jgi:hypothetical protein